VVEVISAAQENLDVEQEEKRAGIVDEEASSDSDSSGDEGLPDGSAEDRQGPIDQVRDYKRRENALHRKHRGVMQWKVSDLFFFFFFFFCHHLTYHFPPLPPSEFETDSDIRSLVLPNG
jgi:hypothetical protein